MQSGNLISWKQLSLLHSIGLKPERMDAVYGRTLPEFGEKPRFTKRLSEKRANAWGGKAGCTLSHRNAIALAKERGWKNVLILEDDVSFDATIAGQWVNLIDAMAKLLIIGLPSICTGIILFLLSGLFKHI